MVSIVAAYWPKIKRVFIWYSERYFYLPGENRKSNSLRKVKLHLFSTSFYIFLFFAYSVEFKSVIRNWKQHLEEKWSESKSSPKNENIKKLINKKN